VLSPKLVVVGHCTSTTARILCCAATARVARLAWRAGDAGGTVELELSSAPPYTLGVFELRELPAGAEVAYGIAVGERAAELPAAERILEAGTRSFRLLPTGRPLRVALLSCNGVYEYQDTA
jgi:hypothetical protein